jgi:hypothetical protein
MKLFSIERNHWSLFRNMYTYILEKIQQEIISKVCNIFILFQLIHFVCWISRLQYDSFFTPELLACQLWI